METKKWRTIRIGTRKSRLALVQTKMVAEAIRAVCPEVVCELVPLMTKGDKILKTSLVAFGGKGAFVEEFEQGLLNGEIDLAVHSAKDMPMDLSDRALHWGSFKTGRSERRLCNGKRPDFGADAADHRNGKPETPGSDHGARGRGVQTSSRKCRYTAGKTICGRV